MRISMTADRGINLQTSNSPYKYDAYSHGRPRKATFGEVLSKYLADTGMTQKTFAARCNYMAEKLGYLCRISACSISAYTRDVFCPKSDRLDIISKVTGMSKEELTGYGDGVANTISSIRAEAEAMYAIKRKGGKFVLVKS